MLFVASAVEAATLFRTPARTSWTVARNGADAGKLELSTSGSMVRADWAPSSGNASTFIGRDGKVWVRSSDGDVDIAAAKDPASSFVPALLLPVTTGSRDKVAEDGARVSSYSFGRSTASYEWDASGPAKVSVREGSDTWTLQRTGIRPGSIASATFEVRPKQGRGGRLASMAGNLLGSSNRDVSATAGVSGVDPKGIRLDDGGDWTALASAEEMNDEFTADEKALAEFQKSGRIGPAGGNR